MSLTLIGAGQPRTGTHSLQQALEVLGFGPCYHMYRLLGEAPEEVTYFAEARDTGDTDWKKLFASFSSAVDFPAALYFESIARTYPDAKIILTHRDPEAWYKSISRTIFTVSRPPLKKKLLTLITLPFSSDARKRFRVLVFASRMMREFYGDPDNKTAVLNAHNAWNERVIKTVPKEKLLVFDVAEGWEPLCQFLEVPVPSVPFPNKNSTAEFLSRS